MKEKKQNIDEFEEKVPFEENDLQDNFNWVGFFINLIAIRKKIYKATIIGFVIGAIIAFSMPKEYTVTVTLAPEMNDSRGTGGLASMAASFLGGSVSQGGPDALNALLAPNILSSTPFLLDLLNSKVVDTNGEIDTTFSAYLDEEISPWWKSIITLPRKAISGMKSLFVDQSGNGSISSNNNFIQLSEEESGKLGKLRKKIFSEVDNKTTITTVSITLQDPKVAAIIADSMTLKLQEAITQYRTSKAQDNANYWEKIYAERQEEYHAAQQKYAKYVDANSHVVFQSTLAERERLQNEVSLTYQVYTQVAQQLQMAKSKVQEDKPAFAVIEPSVVPLLPSSTSRVLIVIIFIILTIGVNVSWNLFGSHYLLLLKKQFSNNRD